VAEFYSHIGVWLRTVAYASQKRVATILTLGAPF